MSPAPGDPFSDEAVLAAGAVSAPPSIPGDPFSNDAVAASGLTPDVALAQTVVGAMPGNGRTMMASEAMNGPAQGVIPNSAGFQGVPGAAPAIPGPPPGFDFNAYRTAKPNITDVPLLGPLIDLPRAADATEGEQAYRYYNDTVTGAGAKALTVGRVAKNVGEAFIPGVGPSLAAADAAAQGFHQGVEAGDPIAAPVLAVVNGATALAGFKLSNAISNRLAATVGARLVNSGASQGVKTAAGFGLGVAPGAVDGVLRAETQLVTARMLEAKRRASQLAEQGMDPGAALEQAMGEAIDRLGKDQVTTVPLAAVGGALGRVPSGIQTARMMGQARSATPNADGSYDFSPTPRPPAPPAPGAMPVQNTANAPTAALPPGAAPAAPQRPRTPADVVPTPAPAPAPGAANGTPPAPPVNPPAAPRPAQGGAPGAAVVAGVAGGGQGNRPQPSPATGQGPVRVQDQADGGPNGGAVPGAQPAQVSGGVRLHGKDRVLADGPADGEWQPVIDVQTGESFVIPVKTFETLPLANQPKGATPSAPEPAPTAKEPADGPQEEGHQEGVLNTTGARGGSTPPAAVDDERVPHESEPANVPAPAVKEQFPIGNTFWGPTGKAWTVKAHTGDQMIRIEDEDGNSYPVSRTKAASTLSNEPPNIEGYDDAGPEQPEGVGHQPAPAGGVADNPGAGKGTQEGDAADALHAAPAKPVVEVARPRVGTRWKDPATGNHVRVVYTHEEGSVKFKDEVTNQFSEVPEAEFVAAHKPGDLRDPKTMTNADIIMELPPEMDNQLNKGNRKSLIAALEAHRAQNDLKTVGVESGPGARPLTAAEEAKAAVGVPVVSNKTPAGEAIPPAPQTKNTPQGSPAGAGESAPAPRAPTPDWQIKVEATKHGLDEAAVRRLDGYMANPTGSVRRLKEALEPRNPKWRKMFQERTGIKLPKSIRDTDIEVQKWIDAGGPVVNPTASKPRTENKETDHGSEAKRPEHPAPAPAGERVGTTVDGDAGAGGPGQVQASPAAGVTGEGSRAGGQADGDQLPEVAGGREGPDGGARAGAGDDAPSEPGQRGVDDTPATASGLYTIDAATLGTGGARAKFNDNIKAIQTLNTIIAEGRPATRDEQHALARYVGWGMFPQVFDEFNREWSKDREQLKKLLDADAFEAAKRSTTNAHYTSPQVVTAMWKMAERMGFGGGRVLEPSMGTGNFFGLMPAPLRSSKLVGVELDKTTGQIAKLLYPDALVQIKGFQAFKVPEGFFDLAIGNVPFGDYPVHDKTYNPRRANIHDYFFLKSVRVVRPGGLVMFVTSTGTMDKMDPTIRKDLIKEADLVAAVRLPGDAFAKNAGTAVVTDIIILRRRAGDAAPAGPAWTAVVDVPDPAGGAPIPVNEYFKAHPEQILGTLDRSGSMYRGDSKNVTKGDDFEAALEKSIEALPADGFKPAAPGSQAVVLNAAKDGEPVGKEGGFLMRGGQLHQNINGALVAVTPAAGALPRIEGMMDLRDALVQVYESQLEGKSETVRKAARAHLNRRYDAFVKKHGPLHSRANVAAFEPDPDAPVILALEKYDPKTKKASKADVFEKDTVRGYERPTKAKDVGEALGITLNESGSIDPARVAGLLGVDVEAAGQQMLDAGLVFLDPSAGYVTRDRYLSGNVKAKLAEARSAAEIDAKYTPNAAALEAVQPADIPHDEIAPKMGATWIPASDYAEFAGKVMSESPEKFRIHLLASTGRWTVDSIFGKTGKAATEVWGTSEVPFLDILEHALNDSAPVVYDRHADGSRTVNADKTAAAMQKVADVKERFGEWLWDADERRERLHRYYNDTFNNTRLIEHDGGFLTFPGMNPAVRLRPHQKNAVWGTIQQGRMLYAHEVGTGKTYTQIAAAMELKRMGLAQKPAIVVLKSTVDQFYASARLLYPNARILTTADNFDAKNRKRTISKVATGDWDLVILTHDNLDMLPMKPEQVQRFIEDEIAELEAAKSELQATERKGSRAVKELEKAKERLEARLKDAIEGGKGQDDAVTFEETGLDFIFVDEAHRYKTLPVYTSQQRVKGIPTGRSDRATTMWMRTRWLFEQNNDRGVVFATGTPIANTVAELYNMSRYLQPKALRERGVWSFDAWSRVFTDKVTRVEYKASGVYEPTTRLATYINLPELNQMVREVMDVRFADGMDIDRPNRKDRAVALDFTPEHKRVIASLAARVKQMKETRVDPKEDNMLAVCSDGRKASLDLRLLAPGYEDDPRNKVNRCAQEIAAILKANPGTVQVVFSDVGVNKTPWGFSVFDDLKKKLVEGGIPADKILLFTQDMTDTQREKAIDRLRDGDAWVGMGSTERLGTGVNIQNLLIAAHHLDVPWLPASLEQRDGRIWRQGNTNEDIQILRYVTQKTFDTFMWQLVDGKKKFIEKFLRSGPDARNVKDDDGEELSPAQVMAIASGDPRLLEKVGLEDEIRTLDSAQRRHQRDAIRNKESIKQTKARVGSYDQMIAAAKTDQAKAAESKGKPFSIEIEGKTYDKREAAEEALAKAAQMAEGSTAVKYQGREVPIAHYRGFDIVVNEHGGTVRGGRKHDLPHGNTAAWLRSSDYFLGEKNMAGEVERLEDGKRRVENDLRELELAADKPFKGADALKEKQARLKALDEEMKKDAEKAKKGETDPEPPTPPAPSAPSKPQDEAPGFTHGRPGFISLPTPKDLYKAVGTAATVLKASGEGAADRIMDAYGETKRGVVLTVGKTTTYMNTVAGSIEGDAKELDEQAKDLRVRSGQERARANAAMSSGHVAKANQHNDAADALEEAAKGLEARAQAGRYGARHVRRVADKMVPDFVRLQRRHAFIDQTALKRALEGSTEADRLAVGRAGNTFTNPNTLTTKQKALYDALQDLMDNGESGMHRAAALGFVRVRPNGKTGPVGGGGRWMPLSFNAEGRAVLKDLRKGKTTQRVMIAANRAVASGAYPDVAAALAAFKVDMVQEVKSPNGYLTKTRANWPEQYLDNDPARVLGPAIQRNARTVAAAEAFGGVVQNPKDPAEANTLVALRDLKNTLDSFDEGVSGLITTHLAVEVGAPAPGPRALRWFIDKADGFQNVTKLLNFGSWMQNFLDPLLVPGATPLDIFLAYTSPSTAPVVSRFTAAGKDMRFKAHRAGAMVEYFTHDRDLDFITRRGLQALIEPVNPFAISQKGAEMRTAYIAERMARRMVDRLAALKSPAGNRLKNLASVLSNYRWADIIHPSQANATTADVIGKRLESFGLAPQEVAVAGRTGQLSADQIDRVVFSVNRMFQGSNDTGTKPVWWHGPIGLVGRLLYKFKGFPLRRFEMLCKRVFGEAARGNVLPLIMLIIMGLIAREIIAALRDFFLGEDKSLVGAALDKEESGELAERATAHLMAAGIGGPMQDVYNYGLPSYIFGPHYGTVGNTLTAAADVGREPTGQQLKLALGELVRKEAPAVRQATAMVTRLSNHDAVQVANLRKAALRFKADDTSEDTPWARRAADKVGKIVKSAPVGEHGPLYLAKREAVRSIDAGDIQHAAAVIGGTLAGVTEGERHKRLASWRKYATTESPLGSVPMAKRGALLEGLKMGQEKAEDLNAAWMDRWNEAVGLATDASDDAP